MQLRLQKLAALLAGAAMLGSAAASGISLPHVHGLAYGADGKNLYVAVHDGLVVFADDRWSRGPEPRHDLMGFTGTRDFFVSSGHPAPGSGMTNPLGLIVSEDQAKTWSRRGLEGESDFHLLAAGFESNVIYVYNAAPNSRMKQAGLHFTRDQGKSWQHAAAAGLKGGLRALAVHPTDGAMVAVGTDAGVFLSRDSGASFDSIVTGGPGLSVRFDLDGGGLWVGSFEGKPTLERRSLGGPRLPQRADLPPLGKDAVAYIAQNPARPREIAIATFERNVLVSPDGGKTWKEIAERGQAK